MQASSYRHRDISYKEMFRTILNCTRPKTIVEFGILNGYTLSIFATLKDSEIRAYDIFEEFNGNHAKRMITQMFKDYPNVSINYGDLFKCHREFESSSIDLLHIDIANTAYTYQFVKTYYFPKMRDGGVICLEGGSVERDDVLWMKKYNKPPINPILQEWKKEGINYVTVGVMPSLTIVYF